MKRSVSLLMAAALVVGGCAGAKRGGVSRRHETVVTHQVQQGETWESIAGDFYGKEDRSAELAAFNGALPAAPPEAGSGVRVPLSRGDLDRLDRKLDAAAAYNGGIELASRGNYAEAIEQFERALDIDPGMTDASFNLAVTYQKLGLHRTAIPLLERLAGEAPPRAEYLFALGNSLFHEGELSRARSAFERALDVDPAHRRALFSLAVVLEKQGDAEGAVLRWREYLDLDGESEWASQARSRLEALTRGSER